MHFSATFTPVESDQSMVKPSASLKVDRKIECLSTPRKRKTKAASQLRSLLAPTYKTRSFEFKRLFKLPIGEKLVVDYSCAYQKEILLHGRMYLSQNWLCFYSNIFKWETTLKLCYKDIINISKERTAKIIPNAISVMTNNDEKLFFTSFSTRDKTFMMLFRLWQLALLDQTVKPVDMWSWAQHGYDEADLYESSDDDELAPTVDEVSDGAMNTDLQGHGDVRKRRGLQKKLFAKRGSEPNAVPLFTVENCEQCSVNGGGGAPRREVSSRTADSTNSKLSSCHSRMDKCHSLNDVRTSIGHSRQEQLCSDSSENDEEEVLCPCATHEGRELLNSIYPLSVDQLFLWLFTDSEFFSQFQKLRKTKHLILSDWKIDQSTCAKLRQISYSVAVNHALAPKSCEVVEKQECMDCSRAGHIYVIKVEVQNFGIPYSDVFQVMLSYCLTRMSSSQSRLRINGKLVYKKSCWGIIKSVIEKNALYNMLNHFSDMGNLLRYECHRLGLGSCLPSIASSTSVVETKVDGISVNHLNMSSIKTTDEDSSISSQVEWYLRMVIVLLFVLIGICILILYNQRTELIACKEKCDSHVSSVLTKELYRAVLEHSVSNGTELRNGGLESLRRIAERLSAVLHQMQLVESSIVAAVQSINVANASSTVETV